MQHQNRDAAGVATLLHIDLMALPHGQHALIKRVNRRIQILNCALLIGKLIHHCPIYPTRRQRT